MNNSAILIINAGSSSIKTALYDAKTMEPIGERKKYKEIKTDEGYQAAFDEIIGTIKDNNVIGVGHRVVHGGQDYAAPQVLNPQVVDELEKLTPFAPLHQPHNLRPARIIGERYPDIHQVACFDTAFHRTQPRLNQIYPISRALTDKGIIRYGFHGSSYEYIASVLPDHVGDKVAKGNVIIAHLGNGASLCALKDGKSVATTMGFSPLEGTMMGTRSGSIDPALAIYLAEQEGMSLTDISFEFQKNSGLAGVSGFSSNMKDLLESDKPEAAEAVELFCKRAAEEAAKLMVSLGGVSKLDAFVFTAGIGENAPVIRQKICGYLGMDSLEIDSDLNQNLGENRMISSADSSVQVLAIPTNEELMMAQHVQASMADYGFDLDCDARPDR